MTWRKAILRILGQLRHRKGYPRGCGFGDEGEAIVKSLRKGSHFACKGKVANTWTSVFGVMY